MKIGDTIQYRGATIELRYAGGRGFGYGWCFNDACGDEDGRHGSGVTIDDCKCQIDDYLDSSLPC